MRPLAETLAAMDLSAYKSAPPLLVKRVATQISLNQNLPVVETPFNVPCGKNCLSACCLPSARLPLLEFARRKALSRPLDFGRGPAVDLQVVPDADDSDGSSPPLTPSPMSLPDKSLFDTILLAQWEDRLAEGLFRYDVTACPSKVLPGAYGFIAQLNVGRHLQKRQTEFSMDRVLQDFDPNKFNFRKASQREVLFMFAPGRCPMTTYSESCRTTVSPNLVLINVSPIDYGHVLLVPRVSDCLPQRLTVDTLLLALRLAIESDNPYFRVGYNSLGAFATINHLHFQAYYLEAPFPVERAPTVAIRGKLSRRAAVKIMELRDYPVRGLAFELITSVDALAALVGAVCESLSSANVPFNVLIADRGTRVFVFPQCFAEKQARGEVPAELLDMQVNPAAWEISGHIVTKREQDYNALTEEGAWRLLEAVSLGEAEFRHVKDLCFPEDLEI